jgi:hypothetical protein
MRQKSTIASTLVWRRLRTSSSGITTSAETLRPRTLMNDMTLAFLSPLRFASTNVRRGATGVCSRM